MKIHLASLAILLTCVQSTHSWYGSPKTYGSKHVQPPFYILPFFLDTSDDTCIGSFVCSNTKGDCIPASKVCNGMSDCSSGEDEKQCPPKCSDMYKMACNDGKTCGKFCDGKQDCPGGEDERFCPDSCFCPEGSFLCKNSKKCLPKSRVCDGKEDCPMSDDEWECPDNCQCGQGKYMCSDKKTCIDGKKVCDGTEQCPHGDDETSCPFQCQCSAGTFLCTDIDKCVQYDRLCENQGCIDEDTGDWDCPMGEDESENLCGPCDTVPPRL